MEAIVIRRTLDCTSPPKTLFAWLADSDRWNRALGQAPLSREPLSSEGAARYLLRTRAGRRSIAFAEAPAQWTVPSALSFRRLLHRGALASIEIKYRLTPLLAGTRLEVELSMMPRFDMLAPLIQVSALIAMWNILRVLQQLDGAHTRGGNLAHAARPLRQVRRADGDRRLPTCPVPRRAIHPFSCPPWSCAISASCSP